MTPGEPSSGQDTGDLHSHGSEDPLGDTGLRESIAGLARLATGTLDLEQL